MRRRKLLVALAVGVVVLVGVAALVAWPWGERITPDNINRIMAGMSRAEVEAILGPPGDFRQATGCSALIVSGVRLARPVIEVLFEGCGIRSQFAPHV